MKLAQSKLTAQGQISVPAEVRQRLGLSPGSLLEWDARGDDIVVRRGGRFTSEDVHRSLFDGTPEPRTVEQMDAGIEAHLRDRHARR